MTAEHAIVIGRLSPSRWLAFAATSFVFALLASLFLLAADGIPLLDQPRGLGTRIQLSALVIGLFSAAGVVLSLAAGLAEVALIFPRQHLTFELNAVSLRGDPVEATWMPTIVNGDSIVNAARIEFESWVWDSGGVKQEAQYDENAFGTNWTDEGPSLVVDGRREATAFPWYPHQRLLGSTVLVPSGTTKLAVYARWWTDRAGPNIAYIEIDPANEGPTFLLKPSGGRPEHDPENWP